MKKYNEQELFKLIYKAINERNHFWWGCIIGLQYGKLSILRVNKDDILSYCVDTEEQKEYSFHPIVRVKYGSPYKGMDKTGHIVNWFNEEHTPVCVAYLRNKPEPPIFETGATKDFINSLVLFTDNTGSLVELRDEIYENHKHLTELKPEIFVALCDAARLTFLRENGYECPESKGIDNMRYKKYYNNVQEFCMIFVNRFEDWKTDHK